MSTTLSEMTMKTIALFLLLILFCQTVLSQQVPQTDSNTPLHLAGAEMINLLKNKQFEINDSSVQLLQKKAD
jgi:hypothetical protein